MNSFLMSMIICLDEDSPDIQIYEKVLRDFTENFGYHLQIDGRPFKYQKIEKFLQICRKLNIKDIGIRTDSKINKNDIELVKKYGLRSIMFRYGKKFTEENIRLSKDSNINTEVSILLSKENKDILYDIIKWAEERDIDLIVLERSIIAKYRNEKIKSLESSDYKNIMQKAMEYNHNKNKTGIALSHCPNKILLHKERVINQYEIGGCSACIISCAIDKRGNIIPCLALSDIILGNICEDDLQDVWENNSICIQLRNRDNLQGKCGICTLKKVCGGCRAEAFLKTGKLFDEDYTCWN